MPSIVLPPPVNDDDVNDSGGSSMIKKEIISSSPSSAYWRIILSPLSWYHCFILIYHTKARNRKDLLTYRSLLILQILLLTIWCYLYWMIVFDSGYYLTLLGQVSTKKLNVNDARIEYDHLIWKTCLRTLFISIVFGLINTISCSLAALWRQRLGDQMYYLLFKGKNLMYGVNSSRAERKQRRLNKLVYLHSQSSVVGLMPVVLVRILYSIGFL
ncbi:unnamed protein product [Didymodactylos carnosus]|uniref:Uncharacterized protein n=1 Tax=Didymodactylos carnosus TaxID=1234261 RepID=A0A8S2EXT2_9BILA|nr:unnamed protein product [Didymodactylos carnosus]CAF4155368.1 unnamed protein product [Didymodactylos carnosus]